MLRYLSIFTLIFFCTLAHADPEDQLRAQIQSDIAHAWASGNYAALEKMADRYTQTQERTLNGKWKLELFSTDLSEVLKLDWPKQYNRANSELACRCWVPDPKYYDKADQLWKEFDDKTQAWMKAYPKSAHAIVARARYLINRGWFYRGTSYSQYTPAEAWPLMSKYETQARQLLESTRNISSGDPIWYQEMFKLSSDMDWSEDEKNQLMKDFIAHGSFFPTVLNTLFFRLTPQWGGSFESMDKFARTMTDLTRNTDGNATYASLYWNIAEHYPQQLFTRTKADWTLMRSGLQDRIKKYPDPRNINALGTFSCMAHDFVTMNEALARLGDQVNPAAWEPYMPYAWCKQAGNNMMIQH